MLRLAWRQLSEVEHEALVAQVDRESTHVSHLADRLLQVARLDPAAYRSQPEVIDLNGYLLARFSDRMLEPPDIRLSAPAKVSVVADKDHVWQIVQFLIDAVLVLGHPPAEVVLVKDGSWVIFRFAGFSLQTREFGRPAVRVDGGALAGRRAAPVPLVPAPARPCQRGRRLVRHRPRGLGHPAPAPRRAVTDPLSS